MHAVVLDHGLAVLNSAIGQGILFPVNLNELRVIEELLDNLAPQLLHRSYPILEDTDFRGLRLYFLRRSVKFGY